MSENSIPQKIDRYEILEKIGEGGMGMVFKARQVNMDRLVALKLLPLDLSRDEEYVARFMREARAAGRLNHPNIVQGIDVGEDQGYFFFSMELVQGYTLSSFLEQVGKISEVEAAKIVVQIAQALCHTHKHKILHRDIKPHNIFLTHENVAKLGDLGLVKPMMRGGKFPSEDSALTQNHIIVGTAHYISPEQAESRELDIRSDIYALGITFYQMLTGAPAFEGETNMKIIYQRLYSEAPEVNLKNPLLSAQIVKIVSKMIRRDREERYPTPKHLVVDLEMFLQNAHFEQMKTDRIKKTGPRKMLDLDKTVASSGRAKRQPEAPTSTNVDPGSTATDPALGMAKKAGKSILVVDDDHKIVRFLQVVLKSEGFDVHSAPDGIEAFMKLGAQKFDLMIVDINMPNMDGFQFMEMKNRKGIDTPVVFLTGSNKDEDEIRGLELGAADYLRKPLNKKILVHRLNKILG